MSKKKKSSTQAMKQTRAQVDRNALLRFQQACDLMVGPGHFEKLTTLCHKRLLRNRYAAVKLKIRGAGLNDEAGLLYQEIFTEHMNKMTCTTATGEEMPLTLYLREGLGLIYYIDAMKTEELHHINQVFPVFEPYDINGDLITAPLAKLIFLLHRFSIIVSDWSKKLFLYSVKTLVLYTENGETNHVSAELQKLETCTVKFENAAREVMRIGWTDLDGTISYRCIDPNRLGFTHPCECIVYIQRHALHRLEERLGIIPGVIHYSIYELFGDQEFDYHQKGEQILLAYRLYEVKLGYLVCDLVDDKIVIRTFLFLTNDGTPESKKLSRLTKLQLLDKEYLGIDTLEGFLSFNIGADERLSALFTEAGCGGLLDLSQIKPYYMADVKERDPAKLLGYLMGKVEEGGLVEV